MMMQNPNAATSMMASANNNHHQQQQQQSAASSNNNASGILDSLPPIVPSVGFTKAKPSNPNDPSAAATAASEPSQITTNAATNTPSSPTKPTTTNTIPPSIKLGNRLILTSKPPNRWSWKSFTSSARNDSCQFYHWVRSSVEYADYPYARFDVHLDGLVYTEEEYDTWLAQGSGGEGGEGGGEKKGEVEILEGLGEEYDLVTGERKRKRSRVDDKKEEGGKAGDVATADGSKKSKSDKQSSSPSKGTTTSALQTQLQTHNKLLPWTKSETDTLLQLAQKYDLRWPVIIDKWHMQFQHCPISSLRRVEDLQHRYYYVGSVLAMRRAEEVMAREVAKLNGGGAGAGADGSTGVVGNATAGEGAAASGPKAVEADVKDTNATAASDKADSKSPPNTQQSSTSKLPPSEATKALLTTHKLVSTLRAPTLVPPLSLPTTGTAHRSGKPFDLLAERSRRAHLERMWCRSKEEEREEEELRAELRSVESQLRRLKKGGKHLVPAGSALASAPSGGGGAGASGGGVGVGVGGGVAIGGDGKAGGIAGGTHAPKRGRAGSEASKPRSNSTTILPPPPSSAHGHPHHHRGPPHPPHQHQHPPLPLPTSRPPPDPFLHTYQTVTASFVDTAPVPTPGTPYLQSGRLFPPSIEGHSGLNKSTLKQMAEILQELKVPKDPIPTKRNCDLFDGVRKDVLTLLILQKMVMRKEGELSVKKAKLLEMQAAKRAAKEKAEEEERKKKAEEGKMEDGKEDGKEGGTGKGGGGGKGKKTGGSKGKGKRPRADSGASAGSAKSSGAGAAEEGGNTGKKAGGTADGPKKKYRKKTKAADANTSSSVAVAAAANAAIPAVGVPAVSATGQTGAAKHAAIPTPGAVISSTTNAAVSPIVPSGKQKQQQKHHKQTSASAASKSQLPSSSILPPPAISGAATAGATMGMNPTAATVSAPASSAAASSSAAPPGKTAKKPGKKRGRKKKDASA